MIPSPISAREAGMIQTRERRTLKSFNGLVAVTLPKRSPLRILFSKALRKALIIVSMVVDPLRSRLRDNLLRKASSAPESINSALKNDPPVLLLMVYRTKNAQLVKALLRQVNSNADVRLWALGEIAPELADQTIRLPRLGLEFLTRTFLVARDTNYVEQGPLLVVDPLFAKLILPLPEENDMSWGIEAEWYRAKEGRYRIGVIDDCRVVHWGRNATTYPAGPEMRSMHERLRKAGIDNIWQLQSVNGYWWKWQRIPSWREI